jgi:predicted secreted protein
MKKLIFMMLLLTCCWSEVSAAISIPTSGSPNSSAPAQYGFGAILQVGQVMQAKGYQFEYDSVSTFTSSYRRRDTSSTGYVLTPQLKKGIKVYWRARAFIPGDTSNWSVTWNFIVARKASLNSPANNSSGPIVSLFQNFATVYTDSILMLFQIDTSATFTSPKSVWKAQYNYLCVDTPLFQFGTTLYWRATAVNNYGDTLDWSDTYKYTIVAKPTKPTVLSSNYPRSVLNWSTISLSTMEVQFDTTATFSSPYAGIKSHARYETYDTTYNLYFGKTYYFRIRYAFNNTVSAWSDSIVYRVFNGAVLYNPVNNSTVQTLSPPVSWTTVFGAKQRVQLAADSLFTQILLDTTSDSNVSGLYYSDYLVLNKTYFARVRYFHAKDTTAWLTSRFKTYNGQPAVYLPASNATNQTPRVTLQFIAMPWATSYQLELDSGSTFTNTKSRFYILGSQSSLPGYYNQFDTLVGYGGTYVWRVRAIRAGDTSAYSDPRLFSTASQPTLYFPSNGFVGIGTNTNALVNVMNGSEWVQWQLDTSPYFISPELHVGTDPHIPDDFTPQYVNLDFPLYQLFNARYYWRARMINRLDTGAWSISFNYSTTTAMQLKTPGNGATNQSVKPYLSWNIQGDVADYGYQYQLSTNANFTNPNTITITDATEAGDTAHCAFSTKYYWRARAFHPRDTSPWSGVYTFTTAGRPVITPPTLKGPTMGATNVETKPTYVSWNAASNAQWYDVQVSDNDTFSHLVHQSMTSELYQSIYEVSAYQKYWWRVRGRLDTLVGPWSTVRWFQTVPPVGLNEWKITNQCRVYPNPAQNMVQIESLQATRLRVYDALGRMMFMDEKESSTRTLDVSTWKAGVYFVYLMSENEIGVQKIQVQPQP